MGRFRKVNDNIIVNGELDEFLRSLGFKESKPVSVKHHSYTGLEQAYKTEFGYIVYLNFSGNVVCMYKEYECGGQVDAFQQKIEQSYLKSVQEFEKYLDDLFEKLQIVESL